MIVCGCSYVLYCDILWCEIGIFDLDEVYMFVEGIYVVFLGKLLVYNCLFLFNWRVNFSDKEIVIF